MFEFERIANNWTFVFWSMVGAFAFSCIAFLPGKYEQGDKLESHIQEWPYFFCLVMVIIAALTNGKKVTVVLDEGWTLLLTLAFVYWLIDMGALDGLIIFKVSLLAFIAMFSLYAIATAFLPFTLSKGNRLWLSIWSSLVMVILDLDNFHRVYGLGYAEATKDRWSSLLVVTNYFLVGMSSIYVVQNVFMLTEFIPSRDQTGFKNYRKDLVKLKKEHVDRYSDSQLDPRAAALCLVFACVIFGLNSYYHVVRSNFAIWIVFLVFPRILPMIYPPKVPA